jgi:hypothetical protein
MRAGLLLFLVPLLAGCHVTADQQSKTSPSTFEKRIRCAELSNSGKWENRPDGPFLDETYYSPLHDTCIFVLRQSYPGDKDGAIQSDVFLVDGLSRKQLWENDPKAAETEEQIDAKLNDELTKLQVVR